MKVKKNIHCYDIEGTPYLLPVGQGIMDHEPCLSTNAVGKLIWEGLERGDGELEILDDLMREFEATEEERPILKADMDAFISVLHQHGFFETPWREPRRGDDQVALIGPLTVRYHMPEDLYKVYFLPFAAGTAGSSSAGAKSASCGGDAGSAELAKSPVDQTVTF
ncbi:MAG: PqqD family protein, partial [Lachnospiraceae bacterium]|nr:PqqD family protein [Lachnospiraceae bacterium]